MPRMVAPPPSGEFNVKLQKPFSGAPTHTVEITGEPNRQAVIKTTQHNGNDITEKTGDFPKYVFPTLSSPYTPPPTIPSTFPVQIHVEI